MGSAHDPRMDGEEARQVFLEGVRQGGSFSAGARAVGISREAAANWMKRDGELARAAQDAKSQAIMVVQAQTIGFQPSRDGTHPKPLWKKLPPRLKFSPERFDLVLRTLAETGLVWRAAEEAGIAHETFARWRRHPVFGPQIDEALAQYRQKKASGPSHPLPSQGRAGERSPEDAAWDALEAAPDTATLPGVPGLTLNGMRRDPATFFTRVLGWEPWAKQVEMAEAVAEALGGRRVTTENTESTEQREGLSVGLDQKKKEVPVFSVSSVPSVVNSRPLRRIAVRSGNGVGKTAIAARVMLWVLRCWPGSIVVTTAPTTRQVDELLWREARSAYHGAKVALGGRFYDGRSRWDLGPRRYAIGLSPDRTRAERFQGFHAETLVFIVDEASDVPAPHWEAIKGNVLGGKAVVLAIGNPTQMYGEFFEAFHGKGDLWRALKISALEVPPIPGMATKEAIEEVRADWGEGSRLWQVRVLGEFPSRSDHGLFEREWLEKASREG